SFIDGLDLCIVMEFCVGGNLRVLIQALKKMSIKDRKMKCYMPFYQMLSSLAHLHSLGIVHRDLKPENVFLDENGNTKTADFGLAQTMISKSYLKSAGTAVYAPSEAHMQNKMVFASDIWVLAVIVIEMLTGVHPYAGRTVNDTIENITKGKMVVPLPDFIQGELKEMLMNMLNVDADKRPTAEQLLETELMQFQAQTENKDDENRKIAIEAGIIDVLIHLFSTQPLELITPTHAWSFFVFTYPASDEIKQSLAEKKPYPALIHLLDHTNFMVLRRAVTSISNILVGGSNLTPINQPHPHFQAVATCDGIDKLFSLFKKNEYEKITYISAKCIGQLFKAKEIPNVEMRNDIIAYIKTALSSSEQQKKENSKWVLGLLAENSVNRAEIEKDGFKIPE
ncbi:MAG: putative protein kinase, partial [Streblomastix strix]